MTPSGDGSFEYRPCRVRLRDGTWHDYVYVQKVETYLDQWGVAPAADEGKREIAFIDLPSGIEPSDIVAVEPHAPEVRGAPHRVASVDYAWSLYSLPS